MIRIVLLLCCLLVTKANLFGQTTEAAKFAFDDLAKNIPDRYELGIRAKLRALKDKDISIYAANAPATVSTDFILSEGTKKASEYDLVFFIGVNQKEGNKWDYSWRIRPGMENSVLLKACASDFVSVFEKHCPNGKNMTGTKARTIWSEAFTKMLENHAQLTAATSTGQITHRSRTYPYLPVGPQLESQIVQFGGLVRNEITKWEQARVIHTAADKVGDMNYADYLSKALAFGSSLKKLLEVFHEDVTKNSSFKALHTGVSAGLVDQDVHFRQIGNYRGNPMYFERAHKVLKRELLRGKTYAALKEFASLENTVAYHDLYDLYVWLGEEDWLAIPRTKYQEGKKWKQKGVNNYQFNTLLDQEQGGGVGFKAKFGDLDVGFDLLSVNEKRELFLVSYDNDILPLKYKLYVACASLNAKATLNAHAKFDKLEKVPDANALPQGNNINSASRSHIFHYPANFFAGTSDYHYYGASTGGTMGNVTVEQVLAGKMVFTNANRPFNIGADGTNLAFHAKPGAEVTILASTVGKGFCYGTGIHDFVGVPATLPSQPLAAIPDDTVRLRRTLLSFVRKDEPVLGDKAKGHLDKIVAEAKILHDTFGRGATIHLHSLASGYWNLSGTPQSYSGDMSKLDGNNAVTAQNLRAVAHIYPQVRSYLETALANAGIPVGNFPIRVSPLRYLAPKEFDDEVYRIMSHDYELEHQPRGWRLVLATLSAPQ